MAVQDEGMDLTIGLKVDVSAFEKEWEANYRKQIQKRLDANPVTLKVKATGLEEVTAQLKKLQETTSLVKPSSLAALTGSKIRAEAAASATILKAQTAAANSTALANEKLAQQQARTAAAQARATRAAAGYNKELSKTRGLLNGMPQFLNAYISVLGATRLVDNIRNVTAEFEWQRTALRSIIQDKYIADQLFEKTITQAVASPFTAKELVTYTKQLAAYRIETEDLFDTTKMLADVSAGLGVSMDRLILAYGQVRAASVLRGTELRQFTEAGIPLVELLAEKISILNGRAVQTSEVFDMISKRQVPFEYVAQIFQELTSRGGMFFDMQRKQSETLYGVYQKLGDQLQLSFSEIGQNNMGALRGAGELALVVAKNLQEIIKALMAAGAAWGTYMVAQKLSTLYIGQSAAAILEEVNASKLREASALRMKKALIGLTEAEEWRIRSSRMLTIEDVRAITANKNYTAALGARLVATKKISELVALQTATELQLSKAQITQLANMGKLRSAALVLSVGISRVTASIKAMTVAMLSNPLTWFTAIAAGITAVVRKSKELDKSIKKVRESMLDQAESMEAAYKNASKILDSENSTAEQQIVAYETILKKNEDLYPVVKKRLESVTTEAEKLALLKDTYQDIKDLLDDASSAQAFMVAVRGSERFVRSFEKDVNDVETSFNKLQEKISETMSEYDVDSRLYRQISAELNKVWSEFTTGEINIEQFAEKIDGLQSHFRMLGLSDPFKTLNDDIKDVMDVFDEFSNRLGVELRKMFPDFDFANLSERQLQQVQNAVVGIASEGVKNLDELSAAGKKILLDYIYGAYKIVRAGKDDLTPDPVDDPQDPNVSPASILKGELDVMKKAFDQYRKLSKAMGEGVAFEKVNDAFRELIENFKYLPNDLQIPRSISDYVNILKKAIESEATDQKLRVSLKTEISQEEINDMVNSMKEALEEAKERIERSKAANAFYEGLLASGFGEPVAWQMTMDLYGANPMDIRAQMESNLREAFKEKLELDLPLSLAEAENTVKQNASKIGQETANMLLGLISDLRNYDAETIQSLQNNLSKTSELEAKRIKIYRDSAAAIAKLQATTIPADQKRIMEENIRQSQSEQLASLGWEEFKAGDLYTSLFSDLDKVSTAALQRLRDRLASLKEQLSDLPADQLKEVMSAMNKLDKELVERDPFSAVVDNIDSLFGGYKRLRQAEEEYIAAQNIADEYQRQYNDLLGERLNLESQIQSLRMAGGDTTELEQELADKEREIESLKIQLAAAQKTATEKKDVTNEQKKSIDDLLSGLSEVDKSLSEIRNGFSAIRDIIEAIGVDLEGTAIGAMFDGIDEGIKSMQSVISLMQTINTLKSIFDKSNVFGWVAVGVGALAGTLSAIFNAKANRLQREIEALEGSVHNLQRAYENLEDAAAKALGSDLVRVTQEQQRNLQAQAEAYRKMYEAESQKGKKRDTEKMQEYWEAYEDSLKEAQQVHEELVNSLLGSDMVSAARNMASAWLETRLAMGDAMAGITEDFNEMVQNLIVESLMARVVQQRLQSLYDAVDQAISAESAGGEDVTAQEIADIAALAQAIAAATGQELETIFQALKQAGLDLQKGESNLTGISAAAANITEDTALTLGAIGNNLVYYVVSIHDLLAARFAMEGISTDSSAPTLLSVQQAALTQLQAIQNNTARSALAAEQMVATLSSVISPVGVKSGAKAINVNL